MEALPDAHVQAWRAHKVARTLHALNATLAPGMRLRFADSEPDASWLADLCTNENVYLAASPEHAREVQRFAQELIEGFKPHLRGVTTVGPRHCAAVLYWRFADAADDVGRLCAEPLTPAEAARALAAEGGGAWLLAFAGMAWNAVRVAGEVRHA